jgi:hypothetical protein
MPHNLLINIINYYLFQIVKRQIIYSLVVIKYLQPHNYYVLVIIYSFSSLNLVSISELPVMLIISI